LRRKENILLDTSSTASSPVWVALRTQLKWVLLWLYDCLIVLLS
jgi:hypothetical protein